MGRKMTLLNMHYFGNITKKESKSPSDIGNMNSNE
jgi:hypothetical protein